jgi:dienelactone hydrolase
LLLLFLPLLASGSPAPAAGVSQLVWYSSAVDNSDQAYGVYLPSGPPPRPSGFPAVFHGHGYGWKVSATFTHWQKQWADDHAWVLLNVNARGPNFYGGIGDVATQEVVRDASTRFHLDPDRLYFTGVSMGGTGAYRQAVLHPDVFAAAAPVDGWTDYRLWHKRWYARADAPDAIEEFRRPLLESMSPLFFYDRLQWGALLCLISGRDKVVGSEEGLRMARALREDQNWQFDVQVVVKSGARHGGANDLERIYRFFASRRRLANPTTFTVSTTLLNYGALYWARLDELRLPGVVGRARIIARGDAVEVITHNVERCTLLLDASPLASSQQVTVYVDGFPTYAGPPITLPLLPRRTARGDLTGWAVAQPIDAPRRKRAGLEGPLGDALNSPFMVAYGTSGPAEAVARHRHEAEAFCQAWNHFNVHANALRARPETEVTPTELDQRSLVIYGSLETSRLLRAAQAQLALPVEVHEGEITVRDAVRGDRYYRGPQYGAFFAYPNPLSGRRHYLVVCSGEWATRPDGSAPAGLGYDLEKLNWAYPDYVVFDTDQAQLPWVKNVNNKPAVRCYEAAYFVEAGFFDQQWRLDPLLELDRFDHQTPTGVRRVAVGTATIAGERARVRITDQDGEPVRAARVTVSLGDATRSAVTGADGWMIFSLGAADDFTVLNVMATGAVYDWRRDVPDHSLWSLAGRLAVRPRGLVTPPEAGEIEAPAGTVQITSLRAQPTGASQVRVTAQLVNAGPNPVQVPVAGYLVGLGVPLPRRSVTLAPGPPVELHYVRRTTEWNSARPCSRWLRQCGLGRDVVPCRSLGPARTATLIPASHWPGVRRSSARMAGGGCSRASMWWTLRSCGRTPGNRSVL